MFFIKTFPLFLRGNVCIYKTTFGCVKTAFNTLTSETLPSVTIPLIMNLRLRPEFILATLAKRYFSKSTYDYSHIHAT